MPYISKDRRLVLDSGIDNLVLKLMTIRGFGDGDADLLSISGDLNYSITRICTELVGEKLNYKKVAVITGVLENVKQEFYRRMATPYEEEKKNENGDVFPSSIL